MSLAAHPQPCKYKPGDWVRFYRMGVLVIGVVQYTSFNSLVSAWELQTDSGEIREGAVLEGRPC